MTPARQRVGAALVAEKAVALPNKPERMEAVDRQPGCADKIQKLKSRDNNMQHTSPKKSSRRAVGSAHRLYCLVKGLSKCDILLVDCSFFRPERRRTALIHLQVVHKPPLLIEIGTGHESAIHI